MNTALKLAFLVGAYIAIMYGIVTKDYYVAAFGCVWLIVQKLDAISDLQYTMMSLDPNVQKKLAELKAEKEET